MRVAVEKKKERTRMENGANKRGETKEGASENLVKKRTFI